MEITKHGIAFVRVYNTEDGESHLEEIEYSLATTNHGLLAENVAVEEVVLRAWHENSEEPEFHVSPRRQFVIHLSGSAEVEASDGSKRTLPTGSILLAEDTEGRGHLIRGLDVPRLVLLVPLLAQRKVKAGLLW